RLKGEGQNTQGLGARIWLYNQEGVQRVDQMPGRGFQSSVSPVLHFGLGNSSKIDSLRITWQSGKTSLLKSVEGDHELILEESAAAGSAVVTPQINSLYTEIPSSLPGTFSIEKVNDFKRQPLLVNPLSATGPCLVKVDFNRDGLEDIFEGASGGKPATIYLQQKNGSFIKSFQPELDKDLGSQDADAVMFDANNDGYLDLYVCKGGYHQFESEDSLLQDRLYLNDGSGRLASQQSFLPSMRVSKSCVRMADIDGDGDLDLFVGGRVIPGRYPETPESFLLINDGKGRFSNQIDKFCPELKRIGMVTDAAWTDMNNDKLPDLVVVGEWMPVLVFINGKQHLTNKTMDYFERQYNGWWNSLLCTDLNGDGRPDLVVGNLGLNTQCKVSEHKPAELYYKDFDHNGSIDPILCFYIGDTSYPYVSRDELLEQLTVMRTRFPDYNSYADARLENIFTPAELEGVKKLRADFLESACFVSTGKQKYKLVPLPIQAQFSPVFTINSGDYNKDGHPDLLFCGNMNSARLRFGKYDANYGLIMSGDGQGNFKSMGQRQSGLHLRGDVRSVIKIGDRLIFGIGGAPPVVYKSR
ncbi:MAG: FG-GAP-like repeat-containing protein, partial [Chitinophagaceae bacterium]